MIKKNILVTGGAGFIGSHLVDELISCGHQVTVIDNLCNGSLDNLRVPLHNRQIHFINGTILDRELCSEITKGIDIVYHLACLGVRHSLHSPWENHQVNAEGTLNLLESCVKNKVNKFFYISTSEIYGEVKSFPITETDLPHPLTVYGASKLVGEHYTNSFFRQYDLDTTVLRIFNNYGPRAHFEGDAGEIIPRSIVKILHNQRPIIFGDGQITRDFFFVKDTAKALTSLIDLSDITGQTFNIGTGVEISMKKLLETLLKLTGKESLGIDYQPPRPVDVPRLWVNAEKFYQATHFRPQTDFISGLKETIAYYKQLSLKKELLSQMIDRNWEKK